MSLAPGWARVQINYKSGLSMVFVCEDFQMQFRGGHLSRVTWRNANPDPMFVGVDDIESVWQLP